VASTQNQKLYANIPNTPQISVAESPQMLHREHAGGSKSEKIRNQPNNIPLLHISCLPFIPFAFQFGFVQRSSFQSVHISSEWK